MPLGFYFLVFLFHLVLSELDLRDQDPGNGSG